LPRSCSVSAPTSRTVSDPPATAKRISPPPERILAITGTEFTLIIVPLILLTVRPEAAAAVVKRSQDWMKRHGRQLAAYVALVLGAYLTISSLVSLLG